MNLDICEKCEKNKHCLIFARTIDGQKLAHVWYYLKQEEWKNMKTAWVVGSSYGIYAGTCDFYVSFEKDDIAWYSGVFEYYNGKLKTGEYNHKRKCGKGKQEANRLLEEYIPDRESEKACPYWTEQTVSVLSEEKKENGL